MLLLQHCLAAAWSIPKLPVTFSRLTKVNFFGTQHHLELPVTPQQMKHSNRRQTHWTAWTILKDVFKMLITFLFTRDIFSLEMTYLYFLFHPSILYISRVSCQCSSDIFRVTSTFFFFSKRAHKTGTFEIKSLLSR